MTDPNAPYINGNPSTGTMGSIPPAASIENPQREIVNFITDARLTPTDADLHQLGEAVQSNGVVYCDDEGTLNQIVITIAPAPAALIKGMVFIVKSPISNTGPSTLKVNSLAPVPIVRSTDQAQLDLGDIAANALLAYGYDGANFQMVWTQRQPGAPIYLVAPRTYYVNGSTGSDAFDGQAAAVGGGHGPYQTIQKACDQIGLYNMNKFSITINVANGSYAQFTVPQINGAGQIFINGNSSNPAAVLVSGTTQSAILCEAGGYCFIDGFKVTNSHAETPGDWMCGVFVVGAGTYCLLNNMEFGGCIGPQIGVQGNANFGNINPGCSWTISGSGADFLRCFNASAGSNADGGPHLSIVTGANYTGAFIHAAFAGNTIMVFTSISGAGNVSGTRYAASENSTISTGGAGVNYYPGTVAGVLSTGGQYS